MYPANFDTQGAFIVQAQHLQEVRQAIEVRRLAQEVSQGQAACSPRSRVQQFALPLRNAVGNVLAARILQRLERDTRQTPESLPTEDPIASLLQ